MKSIIVTGGTRGIGRSISEMYLKKGYRVIVSYVTSDESANNFLNDNNIYRDNIFLIKEDLSSYDGMLNFVETIKSLKFNIDGIVFNAGITKRESFSEISIDTWEDVFRCNLTIPFFIVQSLYCCIEENAHVTFIGSILGIKADGMSMPYGISKGSLSIMVKYLAKSSEYKKIRFNVVSPGFINTEWHVSKSEEIINNISAKTLANRFGEVDEVASVCSLLDDNEYINGQTIVVDGGYIIK